MTTVSEAEQRRNKFRIPRKTLWTALIALALAVLGNMLLLGLPGALLLELTVPFTSVALQARYAALGAGVWPAAIYYTLLWPIGLLVADLITRALAHRRRAWLQVALYLLVLLGWSYGLTLFFLSNL